MYIFIDSFSPMYSIILQTLLYGLFKDKVNADTYDIRNADTVTEFFTGLFLTVFGKFAALFI